MRSRKHCLPEGAMDDSPLRIPSLDGGGVRGISPLYILKEIMAQVSRQRVFDRPNEPRSICGTSTGGLVTLMLGRPEMVDLLLIHLLTCRTSMRPLTATRLSQRRSSHPSRKATGQVRSRNRTCRDESILYFPTDSHGCYDLVKYFNYSFDQGSR